MERQNGKFSYDSNEEDWDLTTLQFLNSQLESYVNMVGTKIIRRIGVIVAVMFVYMYDGNRKPFCYIKT